MLHMRAGPANAPSCTLTHPLALSPACPSLLEHSYTAPRFRHGANDTVGPDSIWARRIEKRLHLPPSLLLCLLPPHSPARHPPPCPPARRRRGTPSRRSTPSCPSCSLPRARIRPWPTRASPRASPPSSPRVGAGAGAPGGQALCQKKILKRILISWSAFPLRWELASEAPRSGAVSCPWRAAVPAALQAQGCCTSAGGVGR